MCTSRDLSSVSHAGHHSSVVNLGIFNTFDDQETGKPAERSNMPAERAIIALRSGGRHLWSLRAGKRVLSCASYEPEGSIIAYLRMVLKK